MVHGKTKTIEQIREEKNDVWEGSIQRTGCKKEIDEMQQCSLQGDWRKCQKEMQKVKECMERIKNEKK